jgi:PAS domain S-box-containing protein
LKEIVRFPQEIPCEAVMNSVADGVFTVDLDYRISFFNKAAEDITGVPVEEALGKPCRDVFHSSICDTSCAIRTCLVEGKAVGNKSIFIIKTDGKKIPVSISAAPIRNARGEIIGGVETFRDMSALHHIRKELDGLYTLEDIHTRSRELIRYLDILPRVAESDSSVLILGESGTGKELFARAIHNISPRKAKPFVTVNCGALPEHLLESELFGYKAGAFTDAKKDKPGRFQLAQDGTLFLDEIGDLPLALQVKILRALQEKVVEPLGCVQPESVNARIVAATNRDLETMVAAGEFRKDLFYRLNVVQFHIPSLRQRPEDIPLLVNHFIDKRCSISGKNLGGVTEEVMHVLMRYGFPGNVRELENIIEYAFILCREDFIQVEHLPDHLQNTIGAGEVRTTPPTMEEIRYHAVQEALSRNKGKKRPAARELGIGKDTLRRILLRHESGSK